MHRELETWNWKLPFGIAPRANVPSPLPQLQPTLESTSAQTSPSRVARPKAESRMLVRPEEAGPQISVRHPRGKPPVRASSSRMPLETMSGDGRTCKREAGVTADASLGN